MKVEIELLCIKKAIEEICGNSRDRQFFEASCHQDHLKKKKTNKNILIYCYRLLRGETQIHRQTYIRANKGTSSNGGAARVDLKHVLVNPLEFNVLVFGTFSNGHFGCIMMLYLDSQKISLHLMYKSLYENYRKGINFLRQSD